MNNPELLPCPFCGGEAKLVWADGGSAMCWGQCAVCGSKGAWARVGHDGSGTRNWNYRPYTDALLTAALERAAGMADTYLSGHEIRAAIPQIIEEVKK